MWERRWFNTRSRAQALLEPSKFKCGTFGVMNFTGMVKRVLEVGWHQKRYDVLEGARETQHLDQGVKLGRTQVTNDFLVAQGSYT